MRTLLVLVLAIFLAGCTSHTQYGSCIGLGDDRDPKLTYKLEAWNLAMAIIFVESIVVPLVVAIDEVYCPIGEKGEEKKDDNNPPTAPAAPVGRFPGT